MFLVGLTGGIASGKSTIATMLERLGAEVIDADLIAREVVEPGTSGLGEIVSAFGGGVLQPDGSLSRDKLASIVFTDQGERQKLEGILHQLIQKRAFERIENSEAEVVVYVVPLLVEANVENSFDMVVTVEAGVKNQVQRLLATRGFSHEEATSRIQAQATEQQRLSRADVRIDGSLPIPELERKVSELWVSITDQASKKADRGEN